MGFTAKIIIYTNRMHVPHEYVIDAFCTAKILVNVLSESEMYHSLFICYGEPDKELVAYINDYLEMKGITTWFFPKHALPGVKLHRMMFNGVNSHDRVLLICSEQSLKRPGVLNEIERGLEREAREGGSEILVPITLDDYVYTDWAPKQQDIAAQIRTRVITKVDKTRLDLIESQLSLDKLVRVLSKNHGC